jgi:hypothetical protein
MSTQGRARTSDIGRIVASWALCVIQFVFCVLHTHGPWAYRVDGRTSTGVVAYINSLGPVWTVAFGVSAALLGALLVFKRGALYGHVFCGAVFAAFTGALFTSAILNSPAGPFTYPALALFMVFANGVLVFSYSDGGGR